MSKIEWTEQTWNPVAGCSLVSPGCTNCYAMKMAGRLEAMGQPKYVGLTHKVNGHRVWTGKITLDDDALLIPLKRKKPTVWFVNSMSDLFHEGVPFEFVDRVFAVMALTPQHTFQILTKRPERMAEYLAEGRRVSVCNELFVAEHGSSDQALRGLANKRQCELENYTGWPLPNVWLGTSVEDQKRADERIPKLIECPAAVRFLSCEPLLGPIDLSEYVPCAQRDYGHDSVGFGIHWTIVGGESGSGARPCYTNWIYSIVHQCRAAGSPVFVKQLGSKPTIGGGRCRDCADFGPVCPNSGFPCAGLKDHKGGTPSEWPENLRIRQMPKAAAGVPLGQ